MQAGRLDQRVTIQVKTVTSTDEFGAEVITWTDVATVWMNVEPLSGREYVAMLATQTLVTTRFRCRYRPGLTPAHRLLWRTVPYNITEVIESAGRKAEIEILGYAEAAAT